MEGREREGESERERERESEREHTWVEAPLKKSRLKVDSKRMERQMERDKQHSVSINRCCKHRML